MTNTTHGPPPGRAQRTRDKLVRAFNELFLAHGFGQVSARDIAARAGVGRSTLYTHFAGPLEVLEASIEWICQVLASAVRADVPPGHLVPLLEHFRSQWSRNRRFFEEPTGALLAKCLARAIHSALRRDKDRARHRPALPPAWLAPAIADLQIAIIRRWLSDSRMRTWNAAGVAATLVAGTQRLVNG